MIDAELLKALLFGGWADSDAIKNALDKSRQYAPPGSEPAWRTAWRGLEMDDVSFEKAVAKVEEQFTQRAFVVPGEMLHVFGLRLYFSEIGVIIYSKDEVVDQCKRYVNSLRRSGKIGNMYSDRVKMDESQSWEGLGIYEVETPEFREVLGYYYDAVSEVSEASLPKAGLRLLETLKASPETYFRSLCANNAGPSTYYDVPILANIPAKRFVKEVAGLDPKTQQIVFTTFKARYETGLLTTELKKEQEWLRKVRDGLNEKAKKMRPMSRHRILSMVKRNIDPFLSGADV